MKRTIAAIASTLVLAGAGLIGSAPAAQAGASCSFGCSQTYNDTGIGATAFRNWCWSGNTGDYSLTKPTCTSDGVKETFIGVGAHSTTPLNQDWDGFQVDAGWCYKIHFAIALAPDWDWTYDASGGGAMWVKVANNAAAHITSQTYGHC